MRSYIGVVKMVMRQRMEAVLKRRGGGEGKGDRETEKGRVKGEGEKEIEIQRKGE